MRIALSRCPLPSTSSTSSQVPLGYPLDDGLIEPCDAVCRLGPSSGGFMSRDARRRDPTPYLPVSTKATVSGASSSYPTDQALCLPHI